MASTQYDDFIRNRITELRISKNISEHKMSLDLDKSGSYIRGITSGSAFSNCQAKCNSLVEKVNRRNKAKTFSGAIVNQIKNSVKALS